METYKIRVSYKSAESVLIGVRQMTKRGGDWIYASRARTAMASRKGPLQSFGGIAASGIFNSVRVNHLTL